MNLNEMAKRVHAANIKWWRDLETGKPIERNKGELLMLVITELSEAVEGIRKDLMDDKLPTRKMEEVEMADAKIRLLDFAAGFEIGTLRHCSEFIYGFKECDNKARSILMICGIVVQADQWVGTETDFMVLSCVSNAISMIEFYCEKHGLDLDGAMEAKLLYNSTREDHKHAARRLAGGKKF